MIDPRKLAEVLITVDGGCIHCTAKLAQQLSRVFPEHNWFALFAEADGTWTVEELKEYLT